MGSTEAEVVRDDLEPAATTANTRSDRQTPRHLPLLLPLVQIICATLTEKERQESGKLSGGKEGARANLLEPIAVSCCTSWSEKLACSCEGSPLATNVAICLPTTCTKSISRLRT